jgi:tRNA 5-methylaminomethyl-2-thiouridine biosynthesis bifunctional protein
MSGSPRSEQFDDIYFAVEDGLEETKHVFLAGNGLPGRWQGRPEFVIAETGFGTGLNFLSAWECFEQTAQPHQKLQFISFEKYPLSAAQIKDYLSVWESRIGPYLNRLVELYPLRVTGWHSIPVTDRVSLLLVFDDVNRALPELDAAVDAWFLDGHAPAKNPDMWSDIVFKNMARLSRNGATCATFTAAGLVKRGLTNAGFQIEKRQGFGRKRDMIVGAYTKTDLSVDRPSISSVAVIGGGLAGTSAARALASRGIKVEIFEKEKLGAGASGNPLGLFNPRLSAQRSVDSDFYGSAYALAVRTFRSLQAMTDIGYIACGSLHLEIDDEKEKRFAGMTENWGWNADHLQRYDAGQASEIAQIPLQYPSLFLPDSGVVSPAKLCAALAMDIQVIPETAVNPVPSDQGWQVNERHYDAVVLANGAGCLSFDETSALPLSTIRGQLSFAKETDLTGRIRTNLCYGGYCSIGVGGSHTLGSTFQPWMADTALREEDHARILAQFEQAIPALQGEFRAEGGRAALRVAAKDRIPVGGQVAPGLYVSTAHGSHGLLSSLMIAEQIAADISGTASILPRSVIQKLSPSRFQMKRNSRESVL